tara:strand:+ start:1158 stop:2954 length:1797 start_codon:yes stop_codon:yes gene_type:complete
MAINGGSSSFDWGIVPLDWSTSNLATAFYENRGNYIKSANEPLRYQVVWSGGLNEGEEPSAVRWSGGAGDIVYVKFFIQFKNGNGDYETVLEIDKTRDIPNRRYDTGLVAPNHKFTIDVSRVAVDQLSYSLCPIGKGTWQSNIYGGMNGGGVMQDNVISNTTSQTGYPVSNYNVSQNGTFRTLRVRARPYIITNTGEVVATTSSNLLITSNDINVINAVNQFEENSVYYFSYIMENSASASTYNKYRFLSRYDNTAESSKKLIRIDEEAEYLNFWIRRVSSTDIGGSGNDDVRAMGMYVETFDASGAENEFYVRDFEDNLVPESGDLVFDNYQESMFTQNISAGFINNYASLKTYNNSAGGNVTTHWDAYTGSKITANTLYYRVSLYRFPSNDPTVKPPRRTSEYRYYCIDREDEKIPYGFVRFHWLNDLGSTDSYTAKRNITDSYSISKSVMERNSSDRTWYQGRYQRTGTSPASASEIATDKYHSDTIRGGDIYKGGREVLGVNAEKNLSVYTEPLNNTDAKWLSKMMLSPNVWIEMDTDSTYRGNYNAPHLRPSTKEYIPVIITNSDVETVNQEQGLVSFNIEYTLSHKVITQRN